MSDTVAILGEAFGPLSRPAQPLLTKGRASYFQTENCNDTGVHVYEMLLKKTHEEEEELNTERHEKSPSHT